MSFIWIRALIILSLIAVSGLVVWVFAAPAWAWFVVCVLLLVTLFLHLRNLSLFANWLREPTLASVPDGVGIWQQLFSALYRLLRINSAEKQELNKRIERFIEAAQAIPDGVVILDAQNRIVWLNTMAEQYFGLDHIYDIGQVITNFVREPDFVNYLKTGHYEQPLTLRSSRKNGLVLSIRFISYQQEQRLMLSRDISQWEKVETMRRDFVANISHELKTPITVIAGFLETLAEEKLNNPDVEHYLKLMGEQTKRMQSLVEDLLMLSQLESMHNDLVGEWFDLEELIQDVYKDAMTFSAGKHTIVLKAEAFCQILGNRRELYSAFVNLANNAVQYTPAGGTVTLEWMYEVEKEKTEGVFCVSDTGIGIESWHIPRLTERFYRVNQGRSRDSGGTGLGLAIVKHVVARHQAYLTISSEVGKGSRFSIHFPAERMKGNIINRKEKPDYFVAALKVTRS